MHLVLDSPQAGLIPVSPDIVRCSLIPAGSWGPWESARYPCPRRRSSSPRRSPLRRRASSASSLFAAELGEPVGDHAVDGALRVAPLGVRLARRHARSAPRCPRRSWRWGRRRSVRRRPRPPRPGAASGASRWPAGMSTPCSPVRPRAVAEVEEALDLLVDAADGLHLAGLVDRAGHRERLADGRAARWPRAARRARPTRRCRRPPRRRTARRRGSRPATAACSWA